MHLGEIEEVRGVYLCVVALVILNLSCWSCRLMPSRVVYSNQ